ncbi:MAG TPA: acyl dehydratase [Dehalococcoidia bacterium]|nr:MaoC family dehydratase [SAR202 cluster bacterium]HAC18004.1 acyl dehydratase [Dehalococcoidia bacterium]HBJ31391.1 acyl dehydratase [Dehalococcoidia bacterium]HIM89334.1 MaoC family dehydratase [Dehalococcoidia bacterium]
MNEGDTLPTVEKTFSQDDVNRYADAAGDHNPIHVDPNFAAGSQFGRRIAHGMMIAASISEMMAQAFGQDWHKSGRMKIRFRAPVFPGETVRASGTVRSVRQIEDATEVAVSVQVTKANDEAAITGDARVRIE